MTIQEFFKKHENIFSKRDDITSIYAKDLPADILLELQNEVDIFDDCKISVMEVPFEYETSKQAKTVILYNNIKFVGNLKLYSIMFGPTVYDHKDFFTKKPNLTPVYYDPNTFLPIRYAIIPLSPETAQDLSIINHEEVGKIYRSELHNILDSILDNPEKYQEYKRYVGIMIRGIFETFVDTTIHNGTIIKLNN